MNYLLYGEEPFLLEKETQKILQKEKIEEITISRYDYPIDTIKTILEDAQTVSLFSEKKGIVVENAIFFNRGKGTEEELESLLTYLKNANPNSIVIFLNHNATVDNTKKVTKAMKEYGVLKEMNIENPLSEIEEMFQGYQIQKKAIQLLWKRVGDDLTLIKEEAEKLKLYKWEEKTITEDDVVALTSLNIDTDIYKFVDHIIQKNKSEAMQMYTEMMKRGEKPTHIIALLASKFRLMYQACELTRSGYSQQDISSTLGVHTYPVKLAIQSGLRYDRKKLLKYMQQLANLDIEIKTGKIEPVLGLQLFILDI